MGTGEQITMTFKLADTEDGKEVLRGCIEAPSEETSKSIDSEIDRAREHLCDLIEKKRKLAEEEKKMEKQKKICKEFDECSEKLFCLFSS